MDFLSISLVAGTWLCTLVAGFLLAFALVVMPGISTLGDRELIRAFQAIDRVIQNNQPIFMTLWLGSMLSLLVSVGFGLFQLEGIPRLLLIAAAATYFLGVQLPTMAVNIPLNNQIQAIETQTLDAQALARARNDFEPRWNRWNTVRTVLACLTAILLILLILLM